MFVCMACLSLFWLAWLAWLGLLGLAWLGLLGLQKYWKTIGVMVCSLKKVEKLCVLLCFSGLGCKKAYKTNHVSCFWIKKYHF